MYYSCKISNTGGLGFGRELHIMTTMLIKETKRNYLLRALLLLQAGVHWRNGPHVLKIHQRELFWTGNNKVESYIFLTFVHKAYSVIIAAVIIHVLYHIEQIFVCSLINDAIAKFIDTCTHTVLALSYQHHEIGQLSNPIKVIS